MAEETTQKQQAPKQNQNAQRQQGGQKNTGKGGKQRLSAEEIAESNRERLHRYINSLGIDDLFAARIVVPRNATMQSLYDRRQQIEEVGTIIEKMGDAMVLNPTKSAEVMKLAQLISEFHALPERIIELGHSLNIGSRVALRIKREAAEKEAKRLEREKAEAEAAKTKTDDAKATAKKVTAAA